MAENNGDDGLVTTGVAIRKSQKKWIEEHQSFNFSGWVRENLEEKIREETQRESRRKIALEK